MKRTFLCLTVSFMAGCFLTGMAAAEGAGTLADAGVTPMASFKRFGENNPLYTQRFGRTRASWNTTAASMSI